MINIRPVSDLRNKYPEIEEEDQITDYIMKDIYQLEKDNIPITKFM